MNVYKTLIVVDNEELCSDEIFPGAISFERYLREYPKFNEQKTRIINLCDTEHYLSKGYYCSLLAEARNHQVLPSVKTINGLRNLKGDSEDLLFFKNVINKFDSHSDIQEHMIYFGKTEEPALKKMADTLFNRYPAPILKLTLFPTGEELSFSVERFSFAVLNTLQRTFFIEQLSDFTNTIWKIGKNQKRYRWDMAILVNPSEKVPPSNKEALNRFIKAAGKHGIRAEMLTINQLQHISQHDALFIRETTAIDHYTYLLACQAENNGLVVMDDPTSILRCCNKVYLHDAFNYQRVPSLQTEIVSKSDEDTLNNLESTLQYPLVLKMPEGSFSKGVYKVNDRKALKVQLDNLLENSALVLAQKYLYTEFDWRIGVLNGRAIYACRYMMARDHWQIYNHSAKRFFSGGFETLPTFEVPKSVLDTALKAANIIGNGFYGVDIKQHDGHAFVLEVNDNPSLDHKVEDAYLGDELYMQIMSEFQRRLELRGR
jgi:glutathione synthase/RimK-type ligase-like ATP-grasp enzyme